MLDRQTLRIIEGIRREYRCYFQDKEDLTWLNNEADAATERCRCSDPNKEIGALLGTIHGRITEKRGETHEHNRNL